MYEKNLNKNTKYLNHNKNCIKESVDIPAFQSLAFTFTLEKPLKHDVFIERFSYRVFIKNLLP